MSILSNGGMHFFLRIKGYSQLLTSLCSQFQRTIFLALANEDYYMQDHLSLTETSNSPLSRGAIHGPYIGRIFLDRQPSCIFFIPFFFHFLLVSAITHFLTSPKVDKDNDYTDIMNIIY